MSWSRSSRPAGDGRTRPPDARPSRTTSRWLHSYWTWLAVPGAVAFVAYLNRHAVVAGVGLLRHASLWWLAPALLAIGGVYLCRASVYRVPLALLGFPISRAFLWSSAVVATSVHQVIPTGGVSGYAFLTYALHRRGVPGGQASLIALIDTLSNAVAMGTIVVAGLAYLGVAGTLTRGPFVLVLLVVGSLAAVAAAYLFALQRDQRRTLSLALALKNRVASLLRRPWADAPVVGFLDAYYRGKATIRSHPGAFARMVLFQYLALGFDIAALYVSFLALHAAPSLWVVTLSFVVSMASLAVISAPGGGGSFEIVMAAFLAIHGVDKSEAIAAVILYRFVAFWAPLIVSLVLLRQFRGTATPGRQSAEDGSGAIARDQSVFR